MDTASILNLEWHGGEEAVAELRHQYDTEHYVPLPKFLSEDGLAILASEAEVIRKHAVRRDFAMTCMDNSPRHMSTVGGRVLASASSLVPLLYESIHLIRFLRVITGTRLIPVPDVLERHVVNFLHDQGDTHGAHFDDYPVALVVFLEAPEDAECGGVLEFVPQATDLRCFETHGIRRAFHRAGDAYLLKTDTSAHRVTPLTAAGRRTVFNFAYATKETAQVKTDSRPLNPP